MPAASPFLLFPWDRPFLPMLKDFIMAETGGKPGSAIVITPHKRPWRYLLELFSQEHKALVLPKVMPVADLTALWRAAASGAPLHAANILDQVALLKECMRTVAAADPLMAANFAQMPMAEFLPWGLRLARLLDELFLHGVAARDIPYPEDDVPEPAARILGALGRIGQAWRQALADRGWSTEGFDNYLAAATGRIPEFLMPSPQRQVYIAGFAILNGVQARLFRQLWEAGAIVCLHGNPDPASGFEPDACQPLWDWAKAWDASIAEAPVAKPAACRQTRYHLFAAYDTHSQLLQLREDLAAAPQPDGSAAIILPSANMLMPLLHELPDKNVNISMGYPLQRTTLASMAETLLRPRQYQREDGRLHWRELLERVRLPFWAMLRTAADDSLREALAELEGRIRRGAPFVDAQELVDEVCAGQPDAVAALLRESWQIFIDGPAGCRSLADLAQTLENMLCLLRRYGRTIFERSPRDEEAMARFQESIIPVLRDNAMAREELPYGALYDVLIHLLDAERIAFEGAALDGLQILGMLETRLLNFDHLYIMDASDDVLPGVKPQDPLLPDSLRRQLGLPDAATRHAAAAYNLFRLLAQAKDAHIYWGEGAAPAGANAGKKYRSRFVERIIWKLESGRYGRLLRAGEDNFLSARSSARLRGRQAPAIARDPRLAEAMETILGGSLSATLLNDYLTCPLRFIQRHVFKIKKPEVVEEGDRPILVGECVHRTMEDLFSRYKDADLPERSCLARELLEAWRQNYEGMGLAAQLPPASRMALETAAPARLRDFIDNLPLPTRIVGCELRVSKALELNGRAHDFTARMDRVDLRADGYHILDYKTGRAPEWPKGFWVEQAFFAPYGEFLAAGVACDGEADDLFDQLRERAADLQLPLYMALGEKIWEEIPANASIVHLREKGQELELLEAGDDRKTAMEHFKIVLAFILRHMAATPVFKPRQGKNCDYCEFRGVCN